MNIQKIFAALAVAAALLSVLFFSCATVRESEPESSAAVVTRKALETSGYTETAADAETYAGADTADNAETAAEPARGRHASLRTYAAYETLRGADAIPAPGETRGNEISAGRNSGGENGQASAASAAAEEEIAGHAEPAEYGAYTDTAAETKSGHKTRDEETHGTAGRENHKQSAPPAPETSGEDTAGSLEDSAEPAPAETSAEETVHVHRWKAVTQRMWVVDREARTEEIREDRPVYELIYAYVCNECGYESDDSYDVNMHIITAHEDTEGRGYRVERRQGARVGTEQVVTGRVDYPEEGHWEERTDHICEDCGAVR